MALTPRAARPELYQQHFVIVGVSHKTLSIAEREKLVRAFSEETSAVQKIAQACGLDQALLISTCNRFEILSIGADRSQQVLEYFASILGKASDDKAFFAVHNAAAVRHLFQVCSGLDSMVLGEAQILGQVKDAYQQSVRFGLVSKELHHLCQFAFGLAKKIRANTGIADHAVSVSYVAVKLAEQIFGVLQDRSVLLIGSGKMAELAALHLRSYGCHEIIVANRSLDRASDLAARIGGSAISLSDIEPYLSRVDVVIGSIAIDRPILEIGFFKRNHRERPIFLLDLGVPRNFAPGLAEIDNVYLYNIDDLAQISEQNRALREDAAKDAEVLLDYGVYQFENWLRKLSSEHAILSLRTRVSEICRAELEHFVAPENSRKIALQHEGENKGDEKLMLDQLSHRISQKLAHELSRLFALYEQAQSLQGRDSGHLLDSSDASSFDQQDEKEFDLEEVVPALIQQILKVE